MTWDLEDAIQYSRDSRENRNAQQQNETARQQVEVQKQEVAIKKQEIASNQHQFNVTIGLVIAAFVIIFVTITVYKFKKLKILKSNLHKDNT